MKKGIPLSLLITTSIISFLLGMLFPSGKSTSQNEETVSRKSLSGGYSYINPLLECEVNTIGAHQKYIPFENETKSRIQKEVIDTNSGIHLSVYFRNLNNGPWFGINENANFSPASLMKLPILIMYLKWAESLPEVLDKTITITALSGIKQFYPPERQLEIGKEYSVKEALQYLIAYSDNTAVAPLLEHIPDELQKKVLTELGIPLTDTAVKTHSEYVVSVKEYASFFRVLYNASYLAKNSSEGALLLLSESTFKTGLRLGIPANITLSHKFGEREEYGKDGEIIHQLHDCGIVYYPGYPYLLCVMTKGTTDYKNLETMIARTSSIIYEEISTKFPQ